MSSFATLNTALSGLLAHRRALDTIGHNIANASTPGYSRRRVELNAVGINSVPSMYTKSMTSGGGVTISGITRIRDEFLERHAVREHGVAARLSTEAAQLGTIEGIFPEPTDVGLAAQFGDFYAAWDDVANNPDSIPARIALLERANSLTSRINQTSEELTLIRDSAVGEAQILVQQVNSIASQVADLNATIARAATAGLDAHDASDTRDGLVMRLADLIGVTTSAGENGTVDVAIGGSSLVNGDRFETLQVSEIGPLDPPLSAVPLNKVELQWTADGYPAPLEGGEIAGLLNTANHYVPRTVSDLNKATARLVGDVNTTHRSGQGLDTANDINLDFFDPAGITAGTIRLSVDVSAQPGRIAVAAAGAGGLDASVAQSIAAMHAADGGAESIYGELIGRLAVETESVNRRSLIQSEVASRADDARLSVSGVSLDEELTALVASQRSYEASARVLTTVDQALDTLINRTGLVGR